MKMKKFSLAEHTVISMSTAISAKANVDSEYAYPTQCGAENP